MSSKLMYGIISEMDATAGLARVYFEEDDFVSNPLQIVVQRSLGDQISFPFAVNEHVACMMDEHCEYGVILGAIYDESNKPANSAKGKFLITFGDNTTIEYDGISHTLTIDVKGDVKVKCETLDAQVTGEASIKAATVEIEATETTIKGILNVQGAANIEGIVSAGGLASITPGEPLDGSTADLNVKSLTSTEDVKSGTISLEEHIHTAPSGGGPTTAPLP
jgi:phage baseplate assembly protein V